MGIAPLPLDPRLGDSFAVSAARAVGHGRVRMRARDLEAPYRGVRRRVAPTPALVDDDNPLARDRAERIRVLRDAQAYVQIAPEHVFFVGRSAAVIWGLPCEHGAALHVGVQDPHRAPRRAGIRGANVAAHLVSLREHQGLRVSSPASTWAMLGGELAHRELVVLGDAIVRIPRDRHGRPEPEQQLATREQLAAAAACRGRRHRGRLLAALADIRVGSMSVLETDFRLGAQGAGLPEPRVDVEVRGAGGRLLGIADAVYEAQRTIVEVEGDHHRTSRAQWERDLQKHAAYLAAGWQVVRLTGTHIRTGRAPAMVAAVLRHGGLRG